MNFKDYLTHFKQVIDNEVPGWFYPIDIVMLYGLINDIQQNIPGDLCEIGVAHGKSAIALSNFKKKTDRLYLYDIFSEISRIDAERNILKFSDEDNLLVWRLQDTTKLDNEIIFFDRPLRLLHIDGCHEHSAVMNDLTIFTQHMHDEGTIVLDDFNDYEYPGVNSAAIEYSLAKYNYENWRVYAIGDNKAYMCKKKHVQKMQTKMVTFINVARHSLNVPFPIRMSLREMLDINVLLCDSREDWSVQTILEELYNKPRIG